MIGLARVVDEDVDPRETVERLLEQALHRAFVGHVGRDGHGDAALFGNGPAQRLEPIEPPGGGDHLDACLGEGDRAGRADARAGTGDDRDPAGDAGFHHQPILKMRAALPPATIALTSSASGAVRMNCTAGVVGW